MNPLSQDQSSQRSDEVTIQISDEITDWSVTLGITALGGSTHLLISHKPGPVIIGIEKNSLSHQISRPPSDVPKACFSPQGHGSMQEHQKKGHRTWSGETLRNIFRPVVPTSKPSRRRITDIPKSSVFPIPPRQRPALSSHDYTSK